MAPDGPLLIGLSPFSLTWQTLAGSMAKLRWPLTPLNLAVDSINKHGPPAAYDAAQAWPATDKGD